MPLYFESFIDGMRSVAQLQQERDDNDRKNAQQALLEDKARRDKEAEQRQMQLQADLGKIITGEEPPEVPAETELVETSTAIPYGDSESASQVVTQTNERISRLRQVGEALVVRGMHQEGRMMLNQATKDEESLLDQKIKRMELGEKERDYVASIAQGVYDQPSFANALMTLMSAGYPISRIVQETGGVYSPQAQEIIDGIINEALTAKQSADLDLAVAKDIRMERKARDRRETNEVAKRKATQKTAFKRNNLIEAEEEEEEVGEVDIPEGWEPPEGLNLKSLTRPKLEKAATKAGITYNELLSRLGLL